MIKQEVEIINKTGLHARPASLFVQKANKFTSDIRVECNGQEVNAKSIMEVLTLGAGQGTSIIIRAEGEDEKTAVKELVDLVKNELPKEDE